LKYSIKIFTDIEVKNIASDMAYYTPFISYFIEFVIVWYLIDETEDCVDSDLIEAKSWFFREGLRKTHTIFLSHDGLLPD
jgi:hypothetical protein